MTWLVEQPLPILFCGIVAAATCAAALVHSGRRGYLYGLITTLVLTGTLLLVEQLVVTQAEEVAATLDRLAADLERNDPDAVVRHISEAAPGLRQEARSRLAQVRIDEAKIKHNLAVEVYARREPPRATASFNGVIVGGDHQGAVKHQRYARFFVLRFRRENGQWRVVDYEDHDPREGL